MSPAAHSHLVVAPLLIALVTGIATLLTRRLPRVQRVLSVGGAIGYVAAIAVLAVRISGEGRLVYQLSNWPAPFGISLVADALSVFMLCLAGAVVLGSAVFGTAGLSAFGQRVSYHPLFHFMVVGVTGAFLTGDVFNLFVWFEVMLMPSYVLVVFYGGPTQTRAALQYTVLNLIGSAVMLLAIGGLYATTGTLNMADIARRLAEPAAYGVDPVPVLGLSALLVAVFALKAGIAPFQFWVPGAYRAAPAPVAAVLAGVTKKVGIYAIIRLLFTVLGGATLEQGLGLPGFSGEHFLAFFGPVLFLMAAASILLGGIGAMSRDDVDGVLAHSSIGQVGFIVLPIAIAATASGPIRTVGLIAALVYALNHALAKGLLFLASGAIHDRVGTRDIGKLGGLAREAPILSGTVFVGLLALVGIPPLSGFFGKLLVFQTGVEAHVAGRPSAWLAVAVALVGAVLTIGYTSRLWSRAFWGDAESPVAGRSGTQWVLLSVVAVLAVGTVLVGLGFDPVYRAATAAADAASDWSGYVEAVDPGVVGE